MLSTLIPPLLLLNIQTFCNSAVEVCDMCARTCGCVRVRVCVCTRVCAHMYVWVRAYVCVGACIRVCIAA